MTLPAVLTVVLIAIACAPRVLTPPRRPGRDDTARRGTGPNHGPTPADTRDGWPTQVRWWVTRGRLRRPDAATVADWCDELARVVRSGGSLHHAVGSTPVGGDLERCLRPALLALERGDALADALTATGPTAATGRGVDPLGQVIVVLRVAATAGGRTAEIVDRCGGALRDRVAAAAERRAHTAQARLSAIVLSTLPVVVLVLTVVASASARRALSGPIGLVTVPIGLALNAVGWWWMRRILRGRS